MELPSRLGIFPFKNKILLPGAIIRIRCTFPASVKLVKQELWQREDKWMIGIFPVIDAAETATVGSMISQGVGTDSGERSLKVEAGVSDAHKHDGKNQQVVIHWHTRGVEKLSGSVTYIVVLEGLCRFSDQELSTRGTYYTAPTAPLEKTKSEMEQVKLDPDFITLSRQFKATAMELISVLEQAMVKLIIQRYTGEAGVRNLERNLSALARAAAVKAVEQEQAVSMSKDVQQISSPLLDNRLADGAEVEMEVIPMGVNNHEKSTTFRISSPLIGDEDMLEKVLEV